MAVLGTPEPTWLYGQPRRRLRRLVCVAVLLSMKALGAPNGGIEVREYQIKAVFLFNFAQFVEWPDKAFTNANAPIVIGILGEDPFGTALDEAIRGERVNGRPLTVVRVSRIQDLGICHILFISRSESAHLQEILRGLNGRSVLTVSDIEDFSRHGGMIRFATENNRVRLKINNEAARAAGLTISSKLLRPSQATFLRRAGP